MTRDKLQVIVGICLAVCTIRKVCAQDPTVRIMQTNPPTVPGTQIVVAQRDQDLTMDCYVENLLDNAAVRWQRLYRNEMGILLTQPISQDMAMDDNIHYSMEKPTQFTWRLRVRNIQVSDEGNYMCFVQVTQIARVFANRTAQVVFRPYMDPSQTSPDTSCNAGDNLDLICNATGRPDPIVEWSRLGGALLSIGQEKFKGMILKLKNVRPSDRGVYRCTAMNKVDTVKTDINIDVKFAPLVRAAQSVVQQAVGYRAELECNAEANPYPNTGSNNVVWVKGSTSFSMSSSGYDVKILEGAFNQLSSDLTIYNVQPTDYGSYICRVTNTFGTSSATVTLQQTNVPQPSVKLGRVVPGWERPKGAAASSRAFLLMTLTITFLALVFSHD